jgi:hypothetical protein
MIDAERWLLAMLAYWDAPLPCGVKALGGNTFRYGIDHLAAA